MSVPEFTVVIPAYNAERTVVASIDSALAQDGVEVEVVVVDDGSTDRTAATAAALGDPRVRVLSQQNGGQARARNAGAATSQGRYVAFLDADDLFLPDYLAAAKAALEALERPGFAYTDAYAYDVRRARLRRQSAMSGMRPPTPPPADRAAFLTELIQRNFVYVAGVVPREVMSSVGGYREDLRSSEDWELWLRILLGGYSPAWVPGMRAVYRVHPAQMSHNRLVMAQTRLAVLEAVDPGALATDAQRAVLARCQAETARELEVVSGTLVARSRLRRLRRLLGWVRRTLGLDATWYRKLPPEVAGTVELLRGDRTSSGA